ncbi:MAG: histidine kinase dimerization/phospho-acceptor domain-containing protein [Oscillospiraceae bacterium]
MRAARDEADKANAAKSVFFAQMSHELRTPLNAITGYLYLLDKTELDAKQKKYCRNIETASENLLGLISNVLDFSKIESGKMQFESADFDLIGLLGDVCGMMENAGLEVVGEEYADMDQTDFAAIIAKIEAAQPDVIVNTLNGTGNVSFFKQFKCFKLRYVIISYHIQKHLRHFFGRFTKTPFYPFIKKTKQTIRIKSALITFRSICTELRCHYTIKCVI